MTIPAPPPDDPEHLRSLRALDLLDAIKRAPIELTEQQGLALQDVAALIQREVSRSAERRPVPPELGAQGRSVTSGKVLAVFGVLAAMLIGVSAMTLRVERQSIGDFRAAVQTHDEGRAALASAEADRLSNLLIESGVLRLLVVGLALYALLRGVRARDEAEKSLRRSHEEAWNAAEERRVAQAEAERLGERLRAVLDHIDVGVIMVELDGGMTVYNLAAERIHGAWREQMERLNRAGTHPPMLDDEKTVVASGESPASRALKGETVRDVRLFLRTPYRPEGYHLSVSAAPLRDHQGLLAGAVLMFSERRK